MSSGVTLSTAELVLGGIAAFAVLNVVLKARVGLSRARAVRDTARAGTRAVSLAGRVLVTAGAIAGAQWLVVRFAPGHTTLLTVVLFVPALFAGYTLTKALTVTEVRGTDRRGRHR